MRLVIMGPPGAGKGTQGALLAEAFGVRRYATGDILRAARAAGTELGRRAQAYMDAGELVPDDVILDIIADLLDGEEAEGGFVLDGFPRTVPQAEGLEALLRDRGERLDAVVNLRVPEEEIVRRLTGRATIEGRRDDVLDTIRRRLAVYKESTRPVLRRYRDSGVEVIDVDGVGNVNEIQAGIRSRLCR